jgi:hypothetical protein
LRHIFHKGFQGLGTASLCAALAATACGAALITGHPSKAAAQTASTPAKPNTKLRGMTWDSIKAQPDWSGMWTPGRPPAGTPAPPRPAGGGGFGSDIPYKPEYIAKNAERFKRVQGLGPGGEADIPLSNSGLCIPSGVPEVMGQVSHEYMFSPGKVVILLENSEIRRIYIDGRGHVPLDEANPSFDGDSIGHWEGDTLVVETTNIYPEAEFTFGQPVTEKTVINERFTRVGNKMKIEQVVTDPILFTKPYVSTRWYDREDREAVPYERCTLADRAKKVGDKLVGIDFNLNRPAPADAVVVPAEPTGGKK